MKTLKQDQHGRWYVPGLCEPAPSSDQAILDRTVFPHAAKEIFFGRGAGAKRLAEAVGKIPSGVLVVLGASSSKVPSIQAVLKSIFQAARKIQTFEVHGHADHQAIREGMKTLQQTRADHLIVIGGGTTLDVGKAIAGLANQEGGQEIASFQTGERTVNPEKVLSWIALPTTSGTGSESTNNAVIELGEEKRSIRNIPPPSMIIADPGFTDSLPLSSTIIALVDALAQSLEVLTHANATPDVQALALAAFLNLAQGMQGLSQEVKIAPPAAAGVQISPEIRDTLSWGSLLMGIAFAHGGLGLPHALVHFCKKFCLAHGHMVGILLVPGLAVQAVSDEETALRLLRVERALEKILTAGGPRDLDGAEQEPTISLNLEEVEPETAAPFDPGSSPLFAWLAEAITKLFTRIGLATSLSQAGLSSADLDWIAAKEHSLGASFGIPKRRATKEELRAALQKAWSR